MPEIIILLIKIAAALIVGFVAGHGAVYLFNKIPGEWLCDYGEKPGPELMDPHIRRIKGWPWKWLLSGFFAAVGIYLVTFDWQFALAATATCWALLMIALADGKYMIIPDQFIALLMICAMGFIPFHTGFLQPLLGFLLGGGTMFVVSLLGRLTTGEEAMGMGDVKMMAACGLTLGPWGAGATLLFAAVVSGIYFSWGLIRKKWTKKDQKPLAPFLSAGAIIYLVIVWPLL